MEITVSSTIHAAVEKVWNCWTFPEHIIQWNFATQDWHCPKAENNLQVNGKFSYTMASKDGEMSFDFEGVYDVVQPFQKIAYTMADGRKAVITFENTNDRVLLTETFDADNHPVDLQKAGWQSILDNFKKYVEEIAKD